MLRPSPTIQKAQLRATPTVRSVDLRFSTLRNVGDGISPTDMTPGTY